MCRARRGSKGLGGTHQKQQLWEEREIYLIPKSNKKKKEAASSNSSERKKEEEDRVKVSESTRMLSQTSGEILRSSLWIEGRIDRIVETAGEGKKNLALRTNSFRIASDERGENRGNEAGGHNEQLFQRRKKNQRKSVGEGKGDERVACPIRPWAIEQDRVAASKG